MAALFPVVVPALLCFTHSTNDILLFPSLLSHRRRGGPALTFVTEALEPGVAPNRWGTLAPSFLGTMTFSFVLGPGAHPSMSFFMEGTPGCFRPSVKSHSLEDFDKNAL